ncbi:MAG: zeta toxin family protein [Arenibacterium sp.]
MTGKVLSDLGVLVSQIDALPKAAHPVLIAIAGAPGSGKSTFAEMLHSRTARPSCVIPMDGFHLDNVTLQARGLLHRKGAPQTFDLNGFKHLIGALRSNSMRHFPTFDRRADKTVPEGGFVPEATELLIFEGNYLLLDTPGWRDLGQYWDASVWLEVPEEVLTRRLVQRWTDHGLPPDQARRRAEENDLVNARQVIESRQAPTWIFENDRAFRV